MSSPETLILLGQSGLSGGLQMFLLIGSGILAVALLVLSLTKWGQARPVWKCVVLSVMAHILLIGYAYGTHLISRTPQVAEESTPVRVSFYEDDGQQETEIEPKEKTDEQPWNDFANEQPLPAVKRLERPVNDSEFELKRSFENVEKPFPDKPIASVDDLPNDWNPPEISPTENHFQTNQSTQLKPTQIQTPRESAVVESKPAFDSAGGFQRQNMSQLLDTPDQLDASKELSFDSDLKSKNKTVPFSSDFIAQGAPLPLAEPTLPPSKAAGENATNSEASPSITATPVDPDTLKPAQVPTERMQTPNELVKPNPTAPAKNQQVIKDTTQAPQVAAQKSAVSRSSPKPPASNQMKLVSSELKRRDGKRLPKIYSLRSKSDRADTAQKRGGSADTERAVENALRWLAENQDDDGGWRPRKHNGGRETRTLGHDRQGAGSNADTGITGLAVLAFMAAGHTHLDGQYRQNVQKGLEFILRHQATNGDLAGNAKLFARMYCHSMSLLAISEALALTGDQRLMTPVQSGVNYSTKAQNYNDGSWRYQPGDPGDMSQFGWKVLALHSAKIGGARVPQATTNRMRNFLQRCTSGPGNGLAGYRPGEGPTATMTAEALVCRYFLEPNVSEVTKTTASTKILRELPSADHVNLYYWYYGTLATYHTGGYAWDQWNVKMKDALIGSQVQHGESAGSWHPNGMWGGYGGRVYSTALSALCLEVYYRYLPMYESKRGAQR